MGVDDIPEVSIIVPVYKVEAYLNRCIDSILAQTFTDYEIILVDDGSPDRCPELCDQWAQKDVRIRVVHKNNGGLSSARNAGMEIARGNCIAFVDSDDWIEPAMLDYLHHLLETHPEAQVAQCWHQRSRRYPDPIRQSPENLQILDRKGMLDYFFRVHGEPSNTAVWNKLYRRELLNGFSFVDTLNEDVEASFDIFTRAKAMVSSDLRLYHYYVNQAGITNSSFLKKDLDYLAVWDRVLERTRTECPEYLDYAETSRKRANFTMLVKMVTKGYDKADPNMVKVYHSLKKQVRRDFKVLMGVKMPLSRKLMLVLVCL